MTFDTFALTEVRIIKEPFKFKFCSTDFCDYTLGLHMIHSYIDNMQYTLYKCVVYFYIEICFLEAKIDLIDCYVLPVLTPFPYICTTYFHPKMATSYRM